jgi:prenyltransferase beta subunit
MPRRFVIIAVIVFAMPLCRADEIYPKHCNAKSQASVNKGLEYLAKTQSQDGNWTGSQDVLAYPVTMTALAGMAFLANGNTPTRGRYADNIRRIERYLLGCSTSSGLITGPGEEDGRPMYGHGFSMLFLSECYGMETDDRLRGKLKKMISDGILLTARGQSQFGGWIYWPGGGDEGSVTVTQIQGLRAANNAGFSVPKGTIEEAVRYLERCKTPDGGICYSLGSGGDTRLAISAAAIATLYNAGEYDSRLADSCLAYVWKQFQLQKGWSKNGGHDFYTHLYAAQGFYQAGDKYWDEYFPATRDQLIQMQHGDGSWDGDGIGPVYGASIALIILQLPYKFLPIYQR